VPICRRPLTQDCGRKLVSQDLLSGQMSVNLDYHPDTRALLSGQSEDAFEIPTTPPISKISKTSCASSISQQSD